MAFGILPGLGVLELGGVSQVVPFAVVNTELGPTLSKRLVPFQVRLVDELPVASDVTH
jgi:hypothetical protein